MDHGDGLHPGVCHHHGCLESLLRGIANASGVRHRNPTVDLLDKVVGIGTCSGADTDKFARFKLTPVPARLVRPPLIKECLAHIECKVIDIVKRHNIVVLQGIAAAIDSTRKEQRRVHAVGDGTFIVDGRKIDRRQMMAAKLRAGV